MKSKLISILITNYNKAKFLNKTIKSICDQNFKNYEIILFDDCSNDNSINIIKKYKKVKLIKNLTRQNKSGPLNQIYGIFKIFKMCKGDIICLLDADDNFVKDKLSKISHYFKINKNLNCVYDMPIIQHNNFKLKNKYNKKNIWPTIFPTSCISVKKNFFKSFIKNSEKNKFDHLEIDARIVIFSNFFFNEYNIFNKKLTKYNYDPDGITAGIKKFSSKWWVRRYQAYLYLKILLQKKKKVFTPSLDYYITIFFNLFIKSQ
jgi:glycosyltransferase involved in cell wall biosynthesis|tara:strand:+ start:5303 stop:6085 length:783 start_codon:yes stop_codon:yes gene_type:complete